jgi:hypothetical protein
VTDSGNRDPLNLLAKGIGHITGVAGVMSAALSIRLVLDLVSLVSVTGGALAAGTAVVSFLLLRLSLHLVGNDGKRTYPQSLLPRWTYLVLAGVLCALACLIFFAASTSAEFGPLSISAGVLTLAFSALCWWMSLKSRGDSRRRRQRRYIQ